MSNPLMSLQKLGQSVWLDDLHRSLITSGELKRLIEEDGLRGLGSNPSLFEAAIDDSDEYQDLLEAPESQALDSKTLYERIAVRDIQEAADVFRPVYLESMRRDGYVSLEVSPRLSRNLQGTLEEARRLWQAVDRENLMIKIPGTPESFPAVQELISEGINVSVTLLFTEQAYEQAAMAYMSGLERFTLKGGEPGKVASVAGVFISDIDSAIESLIAERLQTATYSEERDTLNSLLGKVACANAKTIYQKYMEILSGDRWQALSRQGAGPQRVAWANVGMNNPAYPDVHYIEALIGPGTISTMPPGTLASFRDHGQAGPTLTEGLEEARRVMDQLERAGIPFQSLTDQLLAKGVDEFEDAFAKLLHATNRSRGKPGRDPVVLLRMKLFKAFYR